LQPEQILVCNEVDQKKKKKIHACKWKLTRTDKLPATE
jgi:hypothetical protein